jgi:hypothetical protein
LDDGYIPKTENIQIDNVQGEAEFYSQISKAKFEVIDMHIITWHELEESNKIIYSAIYRRAEELTRKYPDKKRLFEDYLSDQRKENELLENKITCASLLLKKSHD